MEKGKNIMGIEFNNKNMSSSYIGAFDVDNPEDQKELKLVKGMVTWANKSMAERGDSYRYRVCLRGRKAKIKMKLDHPNYSWARTKGPVQYDCWGNIVGGIKNAQEVRCYIYRRVR